MTELELQSTQPHNIEQSGDVNLLALLVIVAKHSRMIVALTLGTAVVAAAIAMALPDIYMASTKVLPPQQNQSSAAGMLAQLGGLAGIAGGSIGIKSPNDLYVGMLKSRKISDGIIERFNLKATFAQEKQSGARAVLEGMTTVKSEKDGMIVIEVEDRDPARAAELANAYVDELYKLTNVLAVTEASQRRLFFERQLAQAKDHLAKAETSAKQSLEKGGIAQVEGQGRAMMEAAARLRAQVTVKEVQIGAMRSFASSENPDLLLAQHELEATKRELAKLEGTGGGYGRTSNALTVTNAVDTFGLLRNVKYYETIYELLAKQYELAKLDEAKDSSLIQVLDKAVVPDAKSKPKRRIIVLLSALIAFFLSIILAFVREWFRATAADPLQASYLQALSRHLTWRKT